MTSTVKRAGLATALAIAALAVAPTAAHPPANTPIKTFLRVVLIDDAPSRETQGVVNVHQRTGRRTARVFVSLHGLKPGTRYQVVGSARRCSQSRETNAGRVFTTTVTTGENRRNVFRATRVALRMPLRRTRTISLAPASDTLGDLYDFDSRDSSCTSITGSYDSGTGTLT